MTRRVTAGIGAVVAVAAVVAYPFAVAAGLERAGPRTLAAPLLVAVALAALATSQRGARLLPLLLRRFGLVVAATGAAIVTDHPAALTLLPSLTSLWLLAIFASTLRSGPSLVEQFASSMHDGFPDFLAPYCRRVTLVWCAFLAVNAAVAAYLALAAPPDRWAFYTGFVAYAATAALAAGEYVVHKISFRFYENGWTDRLWRRWFPPERTALGRRTLQWQIARGQAESRR